MQNIQNKVHQNVNEGIPAQVLMSEHSFFIKTKQNVGGGKKKSKNSSCLHGFL